MFLMSLLAYTLQEVVTRKPRSCGEIDGDRADLMFFETHNGRHNAGAYFASNQSEFKVV
jgi:hypothetical protein